MPRKSTAPPLQKIMTKVRPLWIEHVGAEMAQGMDIRASFEEQLARFYTMLEQCVTTGDSAWIDSILLDWAKSSTETDLTQGLYQVSFMLNRFIALTIQVARDNLTKQQALDFLGAVIPIYTYGLSAVSRYEMESRVAHISGEMEKVQRKLEHVDKSKSAFISVAAHELKTPITLIEGYSAMMSDLIRENKSADLDSLLRGMFAGIGRMRSIVDDMIDVSMIDNNLLSLNFQPMQISQTLDLLQKDITPALKERNITLERKEFEGHKLWIYYDPARIKQALQNILHNAIKYTPNGGRITIDGRLLPGFLEVIIADTGIGIAPENLLIIFEKFSSLGRVNLHSSGKTKFKGGGPGLGLPIAKGILEAHQGSLWAESPGHDEVSFPGSIFHILIPARAESPDPIVTKIFDSLGHTS